MFSKVATIRIESSKVIFVFFVFGERGATKENVLSLLGRKIDFVTLFPIEFSEVR